MNAVPRLTVGLPVYNGEKYLEKSIEALLSQRLSGLRAGHLRQCLDGRHPGHRRRFAKEDSRIRYIRQPRNIGGALNHNFLIREASELFKAASHDDLYHPDLLKYCVAALDDNPDAVLAHSWSAVINAAGDVRRPSLPGAYLLAAGARAVPQHALRRLG